MLSFLSRLTGGDGKACLKIQLQNDFVFLRGPPGESAEQPLKGVVSLRLPIGGQANGVRLRMAGFLRCRLHDVCSTSPDFRTVRVFEHEWPPFVIDYALRVDSVDHPDLEIYEWPFELMIPGDTQETFKGCSSCSINYQLTGTTIRGKTSTGTPQAYHPVRISRTLQNSAFEWMDPATMEGAWEDKMAYRIAIQHRAVALGTAIPIEMHLTPLKKKSKVSRIHVELLEIHTFEYNGSRPLPSFTGERQVAEWFASVEMREDSLQPHYRVVQKLPLPSEPKQCSSDIEMEGISTKHVLHIVVDVAESGDELFRTRYHAKIPVVLFISPKLPVDASENFVRPENTAGNDDLSAPFAALEVPPMYGKHETDEMFDLVSGRNPFE